MCLIVKNGSAFVAQEDIQTYKVVLIDKRALQTKEKTDWHGLYQFRKHFPFDVVLEETGSNEDDMHKSKLSYRTISIAGGFFHSTTDIEDAMKLEQSIKYYEYYEEFGERIYRGGYKSFGKLMLVSVICKATIPKGSVCYKGAYDQHRMASTKLIVHYPF